MPRARFTALVGLAVIASACAGPSPSLPAVGTPSPSASATASPTVSPTATASPTATPEPPLSLALPTTVDQRAIRYTITPSVPITKGTGSFTVRVTSLASTRIKELVLRWPSPLDRIVYFAPFAPSPSRLTDALIQPWTKWVVGPGEMGEPAGTTSVGWGPLLPHATLVIPLVATRKAVGKVAFDLQFLAGEAILSTAGGAPAEARVTIP